MRTQSSKLGMLKEQIEQVIGKPFDSFQQAVGALKQLGIERGLIGEDEPLHLSAAINLIDALGVSSSTAGATGGSGGGMLAAPVGSGTGTGTLPKKTISSGVINPSGRASSAGTFSTEALVKLAESVLGRLPSVPEAERRELALRVLWQSRLDCELPASLRDEIAASDLAGRYWRPPAPTGYERCARVNRVERLKAAIAKLTA